MFKKIILTFLIIGWTSISFAEQCPNLSISTEYDKTKWEIIPYGMTISNTNNSFVGAGWNVGFLGIGCQYYNPTLPLPLFTLFTLNWHPKPIEEDTAWIIDKGHNTGKCIASGGAYVNCPFTED